MSLIMLVAGITLLVMFGMTIVSAVINLVAERRQPLDSGRNAGGFTFFRNGLLTVVLVGIVPLVILKARSVQSHSTRVSDEITVDVKHSLHEALHDLSEARQDIQNSVRDVAKEIPLEIPGIVTPATIAREQPGSGVVATVAIADEQSSGSPVSVVPDTIVKLDTGSLADAEELRKRKLELTAHIGHWVQSLLSKSTQENSTAGADAAQAAESSNGDVVVLQLSDQVVKQLLGESGHELLKSFNSELPDRIRQTYALIPLTPPVDAAVSPMRPLLASGGLEAIANSLVSIVENADSGVSDQHQTGIETAVALSAAPANAEMPAWVRQPDGGRIVAETDPLLPGDDSAQPLTDAINKALAKHLSVVTESLDPVLNNQSRFVKLELDRATAERCIVERFERKELIETAAEGSKEFHKVYALVVFPESVDKAAVQEIRHSLQKDRIAGLGIVVACVWLSVCSAGCGIRLGRNGGKWLRLVATPVAGAIALLLILGAVALAFNFTRDLPVRPAWLPDGKTVEIHVDGSV